MMPSPKIGLSASGKTWKKFGATMGMRPKQIEIATTRTLLRCREKSTVEGFLIPVAVIMPNMMAPTPTGSACGAEATMQRDLIVRQMQRAAQDQRHGDRIRIHHEHVLEAQSGQLRSRQNLVDRMYGRRHQKPSQRLCAQPPSCMHFHKTACP